MVFLLLVCFVFVFNFFFFTMALSKTVPKSSEFMALSTCLYISPYLISLSFSFFTYEMVVTGELDSLVVVTWVKLHAMLLVKC